MALVWKKCRGLRLLSIWPFFSRCFNAQLIAPTATLELRETSCHPDSNTPINKDMPPTIKSVAIIGAGASGAASASSLAAEGYFDVIKVFERREEPGGTWIYDAIPPDLKLVPGGLPHNIDPPLAIPEVLPTTTAPNTQERFTKTPIYDGLT